MDPALHRTNYDSVIPLPPTAEKAAGAAFFEHCYTGHLMLICVDMGGTFYQTEGPVTIIPEDHDHAEEPSKYPPAKPGALVCEPLKAALTEPLAVPCDP